MATAVRRIAAGFRLREFALRAFESDFLGAVGAWLAASQFHTRSAHRAARWLHRVGSRRCGLVRKRHDFSAEARWLCITEWGIAFWSWRAQRSNPSYCKKASWIASLRSQ